MFIVLVTSARAHPADGQIDDITVPVLLTTDLCRAIIFARRVDETKFDFVNGDTQGVRIFHTKVGLYDDRQRGSSSPFFSRTPHMSPPYTGDINVSWSERWLDIDYKAKYDALAAKL